MEQETILQQRETVLQQAEAIQGVQATLRELLASETVEPVRKRLQDSLAELTATELRLKEASFLLTVADGLSKSNK